MNRRAVCRTTLLVLATVFSACNRDETTGVPAISPSVAGSPDVLRDNIAFFTRQFSATGDVAVMNSDGSGRRPLAGAAGGFEPAISPDGRRIAFSRNTEPGVTAIYVMDVDGSGVTPIVQGLVFNPGPVWSPDGCRIAFRSQVEGRTGPVGRISIINEDGTGLRQVSPEPGANDFAFDEGPTWSPDGTRLAFTRNTVLHVVNVDGTGLTPLSNEDGAQSAAWSPDGQQIAYRSTDPHGDIHVRNADGSNLVLVTTTPDFDGWPRWSPDGRRLVLSRSANDQVQIVTINADGTGAVRLTPDGIDDFMPDWGGRGSAPALCSGVQVEVTPPAATLAPSETRQFAATVRDGGTVLERARVQWSSSNEAVATVTPAGLVTAVAVGAAEIQAAFANRTARARVTVVDNALRNVILYSTQAFGTPSDIAIVHPDGTGFRRLTSDHFGYASPDISPDGRRIAFARPGIGNWAVYTMNADGTGATKLVQRSALDTDPAWSPDGSQIAFRSENDTEFGPLSRIFVINADGTGVRQVSPDTDPERFFFFDATPSWSPDGTKIAFIRNSGINIINVEGTEMTALSVAGASGADWSPDGTRLVFSGDNADGSDANIYVVNADGSNLFAVTATAEFDSHPRWSPDSRRIVFCRVINDDHFELFIINADGTGEYNLAVGCPASWSPVP